MKPSSSINKEIPLEIAGSTKFGRYNKISDEQTINMIISDNWLVPFAGYQNVQTISPTGEGRGLYASTKLGKMFAVINNDVYSFDTSLNRTFIGRLNTFVGNVFISENNVGQVIFSDLTFLYLYNNNDGSFGVVPNVDFIPGHITFQNGRFISPSTQITVTGGTITNQWRLSEVNDGSKWTFGSAFVGLLQTKPDTTVATIRFPGRGNLLMVCGLTVCEQWYDAGNASLFPYQRSQSTNIDFGIVNAATIAEMDNIVCWLGANEKSGPVIMYSNGGDISHVSTDGIDFKFSQLKDPTNSYGFMFKQDGHVIYVVTFITDNLSYMYDFNTQRIFTLTDEHGDAFIAKRVVFFNDNYYFVSIRDGNLYQFGTQFLDYDYGNDVVFEIPRIRITAPIRLPDQSRFIVTSVGFTIEQGQIDFDSRDTTFDLMTEDFNYICTENLLVLGGGFNYRGDVPVIDMSFSKDGGFNFGHIARREMNNFGIRQNRLMWWRMGQANDISFQFRFNGFGRFIATNGVVGLHL